MPKVESIPINDPERTMNVLFDHALVSRDMLQRAWSPDTAYQGINLHDDDLPSRGQCGVSSLWLAHHLNTQNVKATFTEGTLRLSELEELCVWVEVTGVTEDPLVIDVTSDQYKSASASKIYFGPRTDGPVGDYEPLKQYHPREVLHRKLLARFALLNLAIDRIPAHHRITVLDTTSRL